MRDQPGPKEQRFWDACSAGARPLSSEDPRWQKALAEARAINDAIAESHVELALDARVPSASRFFKPHRMISGLEVALPYHVVLSLETAWAELDYQAHQLEESASHVLDDILRAKLMQTIAQLKEDLQRQRRAHLRLVP